MTQLPDSLAWTPERAMHANILTAYHGHKVSQGERFACLKFSTIGHAVSWAGSTDMTSRVRIITPDSDVTLDAAVTVHLDMAPF